MPLFLLFTSPSFLVFLFLLIGGATQLQAGQFSTALSEFIANNSEEENIAFFQACYPLSVNLPGEHGGSCQVDGNFCNSSGNFTFIYTNYQTAPGLFFSGTINTTLTFDSMLSPTYVKITMDGGPINATYSGQPYELYYNQIEVNLSLTTMQLTTVNGSIMINGQSYPLDDNLANLLIL
jgi:hypothetical protein